MRTRANRAYEAVITKVYGNQTEDDDTNVKYDAETIDDADVIRISNQPPHRRLLFVSVTTRPRIIPAPVGSACRIKHIFGEYRLTDVEEQYIVGEECE